ncbi:MAG: PD40 domain-containing protein [Chitinispirillaceae bacterium]|nr:PD40 domain-containing protein [Chitinispirillaceae bacterium]
MQRNQLQITIVLGVSCMLLGFSPLLGFGKNKVQYADLNWHYLPASHFTLYYHQNQGTLPEFSFRLMEDIYRALSRRLQFTHKDPVPVIVYGDPTLFAQTNVIMELLPEGVGGFTELFKNRVVIPFNGSYDEYKHVLHHEMVHAFVFGIFYDQLGSSLLMGGGIQIPLWFNEGLAEYLSSGWNVESDMFLMDFTISSEVPPPGPMLGGYMAYKGGQSFLFFLASTYGDSLFTKFLRDFKSSKSLEKTLEHVYKKKIKDLGKEWIHELKRIYWPEIGRRSNPKRTATALTKQDPSRDHFNLRPRISPDGKRIAFFSDRYDYTKILITNRKGNVLQSISQRGYGGYFESFHPFRSGMCWSPDGRKLAFVTTSNGRDQIRIVDVDRKKLIKTISTGLSSIVGPDWSRNGAMIAFSGIDSGMSNLFLYHMTTDSLVRLTNSVTFKSDPRFSPNDSFIVFTVQDTCLEVDDPPIGAWSKKSCDLALLSLKGGNNEVKLLSATAWNEKQPCFSPDGKQVMFVSDRNGIDNVYIAALDSVENASPITNYYGGCSNPDWSVDGKDAVFTLFQNLRWDVWLMEKPAEKTTNRQLEPTKWIQTRLDSNSHYFTPADIKGDSTELARSSQVQTEQKADSLSPSADSVISELGVPDSVTTDSLDAPETESAKEKTDTATLLAQASDSVTTDSLDAPEAESAKEKTDTATLLAQASDSTRDTARQKSETALPPRKPYRLKFSPDLVTMGVGMSSFYGYAGQWLLSLSDIMGDHRITLAGDVQNDFQSTMHFFGSYLYMKKRINIGGGAYYYKDYVGYGYSDLFYYDAELGGFFLASYPFSLFSRIDLEIMVRTIERTPRSFSLPDSALGEGYRINTFLPSLSYSYDNILWGMTGPLAGMRTNVSLNILPPFSFTNDPFFSGEIDARHYVHLFKRFVWANRVFVGASQSLSSDPSPRRYLLGGNENWLFTYSDSDLNIEQYEKNVRYAFYSTLVVPFRGWRYFDLSGTRVAVLNSEFRFPFIREFSTVFPLPIAIRYVNGAVFVDMGNAWNREDQTNGLPLPSKLYGGVGFGMRMDLGIFLLRYDRGWPVDVGERTYGRPINYFSLGAEF